MKPTDVPITLRVTVSYQAEPSPLILRALSEVANERAAADRERLRIERDKQEKRIREFHNLLAALGIFRDSPTAETMLIDPLYLREQDIYFRYCFDTEEGAAKLQIGLDGAHTRHIQWSTILVTTLLDLGYAIEQILADEGTDTPFAH